MRAITSTARAARTAEVRRGDGRLASAGVSTHLSTALISASRSERVLTQVGIEAVQQRSLGARERQRGKSGSPLPQGRVAGLAGENEPCGLARLPGPRQADDLPFEVPDVSSGASSRAQPERPVEVESDAKLGVRGFCEDC